MFRGALDEDTRLVPRPAVPMATVYDANMTQVKGPAKSIARLTKELSKILPDSP